MTDDELRSPEALPEQVVADPPEADVRPDFEDDDDLGHGFGDRWRAAWRVGARCVVRVSTLFQAKQSKGSLKTQRDEVAALASFGVPADRIQTVELLGESASADADRPKFRAEVLEPARAGRYRILCVTRDDRISRNGPDSEELYDVLADNDGFVVIGGVIYDPANQAHRMMLKIGSAVAEYENAQRAERTSKDRLAKAMNAQVLVAFTAGVVWADKDDPEFRKRMVDAGLEGYLTAESINAGRAHCTRDGRVLRPFPYPDRDVWKALNLSIEWMLELRDLRAVLDRVLRDPRWPRPGEYPVSTSYVYQPDMPHLWGSVQGEYGELKRGLQRFRKWLRHPELYGIYEYTGTVRRGRTRKDRTKKRRVLIRDAFRGPRPAAEWDRISKILSDGREGRRGHRFLGPKIHWTPLMRCGHILPDGRICGYRMRPEYTADGRPVSAIGGCFERHDQFSVPQQLVDSAVVEAVLAAYSPAQIARLVGRVQVDRSVDRTRAARLAAEIDELERKIKRTMKLQLEAADDEDASDWMAERKSARAEVKRKQKELVTLVGEERELADVESSEIGRLLSLAADLRELLPRAAAIPGKVREILGEFVDCVYLRQLAKYVFLLEIVFPAGGTVRRVAISRPVFMTQGIRAYAYMRLAREIAAWVDHGTGVAREALHAAAEEVGSELETYLADVRRYRPFSGARILSAALTHAYSEPVDCPTTRRESVADLAARIGEPVDAVMREVLLGNLGAVTVEEGGLMIAPDARQLHETFPRLARRQVAERAGWPLEDTALAHVVAREAGFTANVVASICRSRGALAQDDAGYRYVRRSAAPPVRPLTIAAAVAEAGPEYEALDLQYWVFYGSVIEQLSWVGFHTVLQHAPKIKPGWGPKGPRSWLIWLSPEVLEKLKAVAKEGPQPDLELPLDPGAAVPAPRKAVRRVKGRSLREAIEEAGLTGAREEDFYLFEELASMLLERFGVGSGAWIRQRLVPAGLIKVKANGHPGNPYPRRAYYHAPDSFLYSDEVQALLAEGRRRRPGRHKKKVA
jgi:DNA invertase Pin-like site-specific DNA recombinase